MAWVRRGRNCGYSYWSRWWVPGILARTHIAQNSGTYLKTQPWLIVKTICFVYFWGGVVLDSCGSSLELEIPLLHLPEFWDHRSEPRMAVIKASEVNVTQSCQLVICGSIALAYSKWASPQFVRLPNSRQHVWKWPLEAALDPLGQDLVAMNMFGGGLCSILNILLCSNISTLCWEKPTKREMKRRFLEAALPTRDQRPLNIQSCGVRSWVSWPRSSRSCSSNMSGEMWAREPQPCPGREPRHLSKERKWIPPPLHCLGLHFPRFRNLG